MVQSWVATIQSSSRFHCWLWPTHSLALVAKSLLRLQGMTFPKFWSQVNLVFKCTNESTEMFNHLSEIFNHISTTARPNLALFHNFWIRPGPRQSLFLKFMQVLELHKCFKHCLFRGGGSLAFGWSWPMLSLREDWRFWFTVFPKNMVSIICASQIKTWSWYDVASQVFPFKS